MDREESPSDGDFSLLGPDGLLRWRAIAKDRADLPPSQAVVKDAQQELAPGEITILNTHHVDQADCGLKSLTAVLTPRSFSQSTFNREVQFSTKPIIVD